MQIIRVTSPQGQVLEPALLSQAEPVLRQLRPQIEHNYTEKMQRVFAGGGQMCVAVKNGTVIGVAVFRVFEHTFNDISFYVDDLVADEAHRSIGVGHALITYLEQQARALGCTCISLESGTHRTLAHKFYFREGFVIPSFSFRKSLV